MNAGDYVRYAPLQSILYRVTARCVLHGGLFCYIKEKLERDDAVNEQEAMLFSYLSFSILALNFFPKCLQKTLFKTDIIGKKER